MVLALGIISCSTSSCFGPVSPLSTATPVALPPGRLRLPTSPVSTGSVAVTKTIGMIAVAALAATAAGVLPGAAITATLWRTRSAANAGNRSY
jgi:hypothetical protein